MPNATCPTCGDAVPASARRPRIYCSKQCSSRASRQGNARTCSVDGCDQPHGARGMCYSHYGTWHRKTNGRKRSDEYFAIICVQCGAEHRAARREAKFCSDECKGRHYSETMRTKSKLPADHPVMVLIAAAKVARHEQAVERRKESDRLRSLSTFEWRTARECPGCACMFTPLFTSTMLTCSRRCARRVARRRRRAREVSAYGSWVWSDFMRVARRFDYCCAYCGDKPGQLDPDHVVPISRGGYDSTTNLLPSCRTCNGDKRDLLLDEWAADREARGKPPRMTNWAPEDKRYWHLTQAMQAAA